MQTELIHIKHFGKQQIEVQDKQGNRLQTLSVDVGSLKDDVRSIKNSVETLLKRKGRR